MSEPIERILVVDDEPHLLDLLVDVLTEDGYEVEGVATGAAAIHAAKSQEFHAALVDYGLGDMTGLALAKELRRMQEDTNIILMTAHATIDMAVKAIQADIYDYLIKPLDSNHLKRSLANALDRRRLSVENKKLVAHLQKAGAEAQRASELKSKFFSIVTHDLRAPLAAIRGYAQLLQFQKGIAPEQANHFINIIIGESDNLAALINDLMDAVSIETGKLRMEKAEMQFSEVLSRADIRLRPLAEQKKIQLNISPAPAELPLMPLDRRRMDQLLTNLISNALKHTPAEGTITVESAVTGELLRVSVSDTGEGIPLEAQPHIFRQFYQVESHRSKKEGLGLGLTIAREIVLAHGGDIGMESEGIGKGARFWFTLPIAGAEDSRVAN